MFSIKRIYDTLYYITRDIIIFVPTKFGFLNLSAYHVHGNKKRLHAGKNVCLANTIINVIGGDVYIGNNVIFGHNIMLLTGRHDFHVKDIDRMNTVNDGKSDICIKDGAWIASGVIILGGVTIGENAVIGAGSIVTKDIEKDCLAVGNPAKVIKKIDFQ